MISEIIYALKKELKVFSGDNDSCTIIFDTELKDDVVFSLPLIIIEYDESSESARLPGNGITRMDYPIRVRVYMQEPDAYIDDETTGSTSYLNFADDVRNYLSNEQWQTQTMVDLTTNFGFRLTYVGTSKAQDLPTGEKMLKGMQHNFDTISFDQTINASNPITETSQTVTGTMTFI